MTDERKVANDQLSETTI